MKPAVASKTVAACALAILVALYVVGGASKPPGSLRHEVQTLALWFPIAAGFRQREWSKWSALPCFIFWLAIMVFIWLFLMGWARIVMGYFSPVEIAMTIVIGAASVTGLVTSFLWRTEAGSLRAAGVALLFGVLQVLAFRISLIPYIAHR